jgi:RNA 2',3'-cyclic 3'-phosphodiesterase
MNVSAFSALPAFSAVKNEFMRSFVAIEIPAPARSRLRQIQESLRPTIPAQWTDPAQLHLTLKFLGETPDAQLPQLLHHLKPLHIDPPIILTITRIICFPPHGPIRIIAAGLLDENSRCAQLQSQIEQACSLAGYRQEARPWTPHITLARIKNPLPPGARSLLTSAKFPACQFEAEEFQLIESRLDRAGPTYVTVASFV